MGRHKKEIKKDVELRFRIELDLKTRYLEYCRDNKLILSKRMRELIINDLNKNL